MRYKFGRSIYNIKVKNPNGKNFGVTKILVNGIEAENKAIVLKDDGNVYDIIVEM